MIRICHVSMPAVATATTRLFYLENSPASVGDTRLHLGLEMVYPYLQGAFAFQSIGQSVRSTNVASKELKGPLTDTCSLLTGSFCQGIPLQLFELWVS